jgi:hypothetical protein
MSGGGIVVLVVLLVICLISSSVSAGMYLKYIPMPSFLKSNTTVSTDATQPATKTPASTSNGPGGSNPTGGGTASPSSGSGGTTGGTGGAPVPVNCEGKWELTNECVGEFYNEKFNVTTNESGGGTCSDRGKTRPSKTPCDKDCIGDWSLIDDEKECVNGFYKYKFDVTKESTGKGTCDQRGKTRQSNLPCGRNCSGIWVQTTECVDGKYKEKFNVTNEPTGGGTCSDRGKTRPSKTPCSKNCVGSWTRSGCVGTYYQEKFDVTTNESGGGTCPDRGKTRQSTVSCSNNCIGTFVRTNDCVDGFYQQVYHVTKPATNGGTCDHTDGFTNASNVLCSKDCIGYYAPGDFGCSATKCGTQGRTIKQYIITKEAEPGGKPCPSSMFNPVGTTCKAPLPPACSYR